VLEDASTGFEGVSITKVVRNVLVKLSNEFSVGKRGVPLSKAIL
jgi:hypothetical protein